MSRFNGLSEHQSERWRQCSKLCRRCEGEIYLQSARQQKHAVYPRAAHEVNVMQGQVLVEVWRNLELYAVLTAPPFEIDLPLSDDVTFVTLDAFSLAGTHTTQTRRLQRAPLDLGALDASITDASVALDLAIVSPSAESCACRASTPAPTWSSTLIILSLCFVRLGFATGRGRRRGWG